MSLLTALYVKRASMLASCDLKYRDRCSRLNKTL